MKPVRISLPSWRRLHELIIEHVAQSGAPSQVVGYLEDRFVFKPDSGWIGFDNGWSEEDFDDWDKRVSDYLKSVPRDAAGLISVRVIQGAQKFELDAHESSSSPIRIILGKYKPLESEFSSFGLLCARNDAIGNVLYGMTCFSKKVLARRLVLDVNGVAALVDSATGAADFHASNRTTAEYFPYMAVLQQLNKQPPALLGQIRLELEKLAKAVAGLPFDDADSKRQRQAQTRVMREVLDRATI